MEKKSQWPFLCKSEIDGGKKCETVCSHCLPKDVEKAAAMFVLELFNGGVSPNTEKHCINCFIAGWRASQSSEKGGQEKVEDILNDYYGDFNDKPEVHHLFITFLKDHYNLYKSQKSASEKGVANQTKRRMK